MIDGRVELSDRIIRWREDRTIPKGQPTSLIHPGFWADPMKPIPGAEQRIGLTMPDEPGRRIETDPAHKPKGVFGKPDGGYKTDRGEAGTEEERRALQRHYAHFGASTER